MRVTVLTTVHDEQGNLVEARMQVRNKRGHQPQWVLDSLDFSSSSSPGSKENASIAPWGARESTSRRISTALTCAPALAYSLIRLMVEIGAILGSLAG